MEFTHGIGCTCQRPKGTELLQCVKVIFKSRWDPERRRTNLKVWFHCFKAEF